jgi:5-methylcytosine-specific restriction protein A
VDCERLATVVDHIQPVRLGGEFWDRDNWQPMCASCHNAKSAKERHGTQK